MKFEEFNEKMRKLVEYAEKDLGLKVKDADYSSRVHVRQKVGERVPKLVSLDLIIELKVLTEIEE